MNRRMKKLEKITIKWGRKRRKIRIIDGECENNWSEEENSK